MDQSAAPCDHSLPSYSNRTVVSELKRDITPFSRSNVPHSQSIVQVVNVEGVTCVLPWERHPHKPFFVPLRLNSALAFAAMSRQRLVHFFIPIGYNSPSSQSIFHMIMRCWYCALQYQRTSAWRDGLQSQLTTASTSAQSWYLPSKYCVSSLE